MTAGSPPRRRGRRAAGHWQRIQPLVPERLRVNGAHPPREEWLDCGSTRIHLDRYVPAGARAAARAVVLHGGAAHGGLLSPFGVMVQRLGFEAVLPDLPGFGATEVPDKRAVRYADWVSTAVAVVEAETAADDRPVVVLGLSMGGLLAVDVAARSGRVAGVVASCLLDPADPVARREMARADWIGRVAEPALRMTARLSDRLPVPMRLVAPVHAVANDPAVAEAVVGDPRGGGTWMPGGWLRTFLQSRPAVPPEQFSACPVLLAFPEADEWVSLETSRRFLARLAAPHRLVLLPGAGHACLEEPGITVLEKTLAEVLADSAPLPRPEGLPHRPA